MVGLLERIKGEKESPKQRLSSIVLTTFDVYPTHVVWRFLMATLLQIDSSPLSSSVSRELTREFVGNWKIAHPSGQVIVRDLAANPAKPLDQAWIQAAHTPVDALEPEQKAILS
jgi:hypothetical protein